MRLVDLQIEGFGKLNNRYIDFSDGINVVAGNNETGKSTLHACIRAMLYGMKREKGVAAFTDTYARFKPWNGTAYGAAMRVEFEGKIYRIERDFLKDATGCTIYDETDVQPVEMPESFLGSMLCGMNEEAYDNTISIGQLKSAGDVSMARELKNYIINMGTTGNRALNCARAKQYLNEKKRALSEQLKTEAARDYAANAGRIHKLEEEINNTADVTVDTTIEQEKEKFEEPGTEISELEKSVEEGREFLRNNGIQSSKQAAEAEEEFGAAVKAYENIVSKDSIEINRGLYISLFSLAFMAAAIATYLLGSNNSYTIVFGVYAGAALLLLLALLFVILCAAAKKRVSKKQKELSRLLERYSGTPSVTPERIESVRSSILEMKETAAAVEAKEARIADLRQNAETDQNMQSDPQQESLSKPQKIFTAETEVKISEINVLRAMNSVLKDDMTKNDAINEEMDAIDMALETIDDLADRLQDSLGIHLNAEAGKYIKEITDGAYDSMSVDDEMNVYMNTEDKMVPVEQVSAGTSDQIYMALRVAGARLMQGGEDKLPLIFDDSFVNYDDRRLAAVLKWLSHTFRNQMIIFSCSTREEELMKENNIPYSTIML